MCTDECACVWACVYTGECAGVDAQVCGHVCRSGGSSVWARVQECVLKCVSTCAGVGAQVCGHCSCICHIHIHVCLYDWIFIVVWSVQGIWEQHFFFNAQL